MLPAPRVSLVKLEAFESVTGNGGCRLGDTFLVFKRHMEVSKETSQKISIGQRWGAAEMGNTIHVLQNDIGIVYGITRHKAIDGLKSDHIGGLFRVILWVKDSDTHIVKQTSLGNQHIVRR